MNLEEAKKIIETTLRSMDCADILFSESSEQGIVVIFNCKEITSFVAEINGWLYSGIHLDPSRERQYRIDFTKLS